ncbi:MAG: hypothetical protein ACRC3G_07680, partial [Bacteroidales bacterium]
KAMLHSECTAMLLPHYHPYTLTPFTQPSYRRHCGLDPQSPIYGQGSCISTNVSPQSIREFFFLFALRGGEYHVKPARTCKWGRRQLECGKLRFNTAKA